ncbi:MAG TPA: ABC transporter ATP-binding protein [Chloroflexota bacterium]
MDGISFRLAKGRVLGLLGPNGAGKTTTIHMLVGLTLPDAGFVRYFGQDLHKRRQECLQRINFTSSFNTLQGRISVWENLRVFADLYSVKDPVNKVRELADAFDIVGLLPQRFLTLSAGQKTMVNLVKSLLNDPEIILMDEPTASLDPDVADRTMAILESLKASRNLSMVYTSHQMDEVARICDEVIFMDKGRIVAHDSPDELTKRIATAQLRVVFSGDGSNIQRQLPEATVNGNVVTVTTEEALIPRAILAINAAGVTITDLDVKKPSLEDVFLRIARGQQHVA